MTCSCTASARGNGGWGELLSRRFGQTAIASSFAARNRDAARLRQFGLRQILTA